MSRQWQILRRALRLLWRFPLRSALLMLSAALGVSGVVCSVNYGAGGNQQVLDQIHRMGTNVLIITPAESRVIAGRARTGDAVTTLVERDYAAIRKELRTRTRSSAVVTDSFRIKAGDLSKSTIIVGCEPEYFPIKDWALAEGEIFDDAQERTAARVALIGFTAARDLFALGEPIEATPWMGSRPCFADSRPVIGRAPGQPGLWLDYGHAHWGLTLGPVTGRLLAEMMTGTVPFCDPAPFAAERFAR